MLVPSLMTAYQTSCTNATPQGVLFAGVAAEDGAAAAASGAAFRLDQEVDNRFVPIVDTMNEGEVLLAAARSGGSFDPLGCRAVDVNRRQDLREVVRYLPGRWVMLTLTVDRSMWTCPEAAYQRCNQRVRRVMAEVSPRGVWFSAFEVQTKTGAGWPHWHAVAWVPDGRSVEELKRAAVKRWTVRHESVNEETGEVFSSVECIGFVDVSEAREPIAVGSYIAKYITKPWDAVPTWMGESRQRFRKVRAAPNVYAILEKLGRHEVQRGGRKERKGTGRRARKLFDRMARSGASLAAWRRVGGRLHFAGMIKVPMDDACPSMMDRVGGRFVRLGKLGACRIVMLGPAFDRLKRLECWYERRGDDYTGRRRADLAAEWSKRQAAKEGGGDA